MFCTLFKQAAIRWRPRLLPLGRCSHFSTESPNTTASKIILNPNFDRTDPINLATLEKVKAHLEETESSLVKDFIVSDMAVLQKAFVRMQTVVQEQFVDNPYWKLLWSGDYFSGDLQSRLKNHDLLKVEYQVKIAEADFRCLMLLER